MELGIAFTLLAMLYPLYFAAWVDARLSPVQVARVDIPTVVIGLVPFGIAGLVGAAFARSGGRSVRASLACSILPLSLPLVAFAMTLGSLFPSVAPIGAVVAVVAPILGAEFRWRALGPSIVGMIVIIVGVSAYPSMATRADRIQEASSPRYTPTAFPLETQHPRGEHELLHR